MPFNKGRRKRIYSAKPTLQDSRRFTRITQKKIQDPRKYMQLSPSNKKTTQSSFIRYNQHTAPSSDFHRSYYNPYQTMTRISDTFLNIEKHSTMMPNVGSKSTARSSETNLSTFTHVQNSKTESQLTVLEKIREKNSVITELSNLKHVDCRKLLMSAGQQMK